VNNASLIRQARHRNHDRFQACHRKTNDLRFRYKCALRAVKLSGSEQQRRKDGIEAVREHEAIVMDSNILVAEPCHGLPDSVNVLASPSDNEVPWMRESQ